MPAEFPRDLGDSLFCKRLWSEMERRGYASANQLADAIGVTREQPSKWLQGMGNPSGANLGKMADHFRCSMDFLWGRVGPDDRNGYYSAPPREILDGIRSAMETLRAVEPLAQEPQR